MQLDSLKPDSLKTPELVKHFHDNPHRVWMIESDRLINLDTLAADADIEATMTPFLRDFGMNTGDTIHKQSVSFIGSKQEFSDWKSPPADIRDSPDHYVQNLSVMHASNPLFTDYAPHNTNVLSMLDDLLDIAESIDSVTVSYAVVGWHANYVRDDPLFPSATTVAERLKAYHLEGVPVTPSAGPTDTPALDSDLDLDSWLLSNKSLRTICQGHILFVEATTTSRPNTPLADQACELYTKHPIAVAPTPLEALIALVRAQAGSQTVYGTLERLRQMFGNQLAAQENLVGDTTRPVQGGKQWTLSKKTSTDRDGAAHFTTSADVTKTPASRPTVPDLTARRVLAEMNALQEKIDQGHRHLKMSRWSLFSDWWLSITAEKVHNAAAAASKIRAHESVIKSWQHDLTQMRASFELAQTANAPHSTLSLEQAPHVRFHEPRDPTVFVAGIASAWPHDWLKPLPIRRGYQIIRSAQARMLFLSGEGIVTLALDVLDGLQEDSRTTGTFDDQKTRWSETVQSAVVEAANYTASRHSEDGEPSESVLRDIDRFWGFQPVVDHRLPLYHDRDPSTDLPRDEWNNRQPWFPLFLEWEVQFIDTAFSDWSLQLVDGVDDLGGTVKVPRWRLNKDISSLANSEPHPEMKTYSGRIFIQPQAGFSLRSSVERAFTAMAPKTLDAILPAGARQALMQKIDGLPYLSAPLSGLYDNLSTRFRGSHFKPTFRDDSGSVQALKGAVHEGFTADVLASMGLETDATPFGVEYPVSPKSVDSPFKPVAHGQFFFTRLIVVDKFGQAVSALRSEYENLSPSDVPVLQPTVAEAFAPAGDNVFVKGSVQLPPTVNQGIRLNADFLLCPANEPYWRPVTEWEDPVCGWMIFNYVEAALQFFLPDGTFYREIRRGSGGSVRWAPFGAPMQLTGRATASTIGSGSHKRDPQLEMKNLEIMDTFINKLAATSAGDSANPQGSNLDDFMSLLIEACDRLPHASSEYSEFMTAIIGRPLALANVGVALELAEPPKTNQSLLNSNDPQLDLTEYSFPIQLGGSGFVDGFLFHVDDKGVPSSHLVDQSSETRSRFVQAMQTIRSKPYYVDPFLDANVDLRALHNLHLDRHTIIVDPFNDLHICTGIMPMRTLRLPQWTIHTALRRMTAFFRLGPLLTTASEQPHDAAKNLRASDAQYLDSVVPPSIENGKGIAIPVLQSADWNWLQPYSNDESGCTEFNAIGLERLDNKPGFQTGPYTLLEGYLQMRTSIEELARPEPSD